MKRTHETGVNPQMDTALRGRSHRGVLVRTYGTQAREELLAESALVRSEQARINPKLKGL